MSNTTKLISQVSKLYEELKRLDPYKYYGILYFWNNDKSKAVFYIEDDEELVNKLTEICREHKNNG